MDRLLTTPDDGPLPPLVFYQDLEDANRYINPSGTVVSRATIEALEQSGRQIIIVEYTKEWRGS